MGGRILVNRTDDGQRRCDNDDAEEWNYVVRLTMTMREMILSFSLNSPEPQVKHDDNPSKGIKTSEDQKATISNQVCVSQTSSVESIEKDKGQGGLSQNQS